MEQPDGSYRSTPFYVKFGKIGVLKAKEKTVDIEINGTEIPLNMVLDDFGIAHFPAGICAPETRSAAKLSPVALDLDVHSSESSPLKRVRRNSEPSPSEADHYGWEEPGREGGAICAASRALSNPDISAAVSVETSGDGLTGSQPEEVLQLRADELEQYNLQLGINDATFSITTQFQGEKFEHLRIRRDLRCLDQLLIAANVLSIYRYLVKVCQSFSTRLKKPTDLRTFIPKFLFESSFFLSFQTVY